MALIKALVQRELVVSEAVFPVLNTARDKLTEKYQKFIKQNAFYKKEFLLDSGNVEAFFVCKPNSPAWLSNSAKLIECWFQAESSKSRSWVEDQFNEIRDWFDEDVFFVLYPDNFELIDFLKKLNFVPDLLISRGSVIRAKKLLHQQYSRIPSLESLGYEVSPLKEECEVPKIIEILDHEFQTKAHYAWFKKNSRYLDIQEEKLKSYLSSERSSAYCLYRDHRLLGYFGYMIDDDDAIWGSTAGTEFICAPALQGKGLLKSMYSVLLRGLIDKGVPVIRGGASHPAMMAMYKKLGRIPSGILMRYGVGANIKFKV